MIISISYKFSNCTQTDRRTSPRIESSHKSSLHVHPKSSLHGSMAPREFTTWHQEGSLHDGTDITICSHSLSECSVDSRRDICCDDEEILALESFLLK
ncbi:unnamed protein product [Calypogeia fissa]